MSENKKARQGSKSGRAVSAKKHNTNTKKKAANWIGRRDAHGNAFTALLALAGVAAIALSFAAQWLANSSARSSQAAAAGAVHINEVMSENATALLTVNGDAPDWIEIVNDGATRVNLNRYALLLESAPNKIFSFPSVSLEPGEYLLIYADGSKTSSAREELHAPFKLSASGGDALLLLDAQGQAIDMVTLPELAADSAYCRAADGSWQVSTKATPGAPNVFSDTVEAAAADVSVVLGALEISEAMSSNALYFQDESGNTPDYVEIHNRSGASVNLAGWYLSDDNAKLKKWTFPAVTIPADGYLAVHCSGLDRTDDPNHLHTSFKLGSDGETVYLTSPEGQTVSAVQIPALNDSQAWSLFNGEWSTELAPTPGLPNTHDSAAALNAQLFGGQGGVYISEVMASPTSQIYDWVEIYNGGAQAVDLSGCGLSDDASRPRRWQFPSGTVIQPGEYKGVYLSGQSTTSLDGFVNADFKLSKDGGYTVCLSTPEGRAMDAIYLPRQYSGISYGRAQGQNGCFYFAQATPGVANSGSMYRGKAAIAQYSVQGGLFHTGDSFQVELTAPEGSQIYYTLDCSDPDSGATLYTGPIAINATTILRTRVYRDGYMESYMDTQSYLYDVRNEDGAVAVVSLVSDWENLTSDEKGIMIKGPNATDKFPYGSMNKGANFWMDWEREAHVELFEPDGDQAISQECGIKLHGQYSRAADVKAFKVIARGEYGDNRFHYPIFSNRDYTEYQSFLLRASGQDYNMAFMRDSVLSTLAADTSVMYQESEACVVYINGEYYSLMYLRERINTASICQFEGWEGMEDDIDLIKANSREMQGSNATYEQLIQYLKTHDSNTQEAYEYIDSTIDLQNYLEYMAIEIFVGNGDTLNVKRYRNAKTDGKWRYVLFDLDWAFYVDTNSIARWLDPSGMGTNKYTDTTLFIACMKNDTIRDRFLTYFGQQLATTFSSESVMAKIRERYELIDGLLPDYLQKLGITEAQYAKQLKKFASYAETRPAKILEYFDGVFKFSDADKQRYFGDAMAQIAAYSQTQQ